MKLNPTERLIYAAAYALSFHDRHAQGVTENCRAIAEKEKRDVVECWEATIAMWAIEDAEGAVQLHRKGQRERQD